MKPKKDKRIKVRKQIDSAFRHSKTHRTDKEYSRRENKRIERGEIED